MALTLRSKLIILYLLTVTVPLIIIIIILPYYYEGQFTKQTTMLSEGMLTSLTSHVEMYLDDLNRLTITPYLNDDVMSALKLKASNHYEQSSDYARHVAERSIRFTLPTHLRNTRQDILGTLLLPKDGSVYQINAVDRSGPVADFPYEQQDWYKKAIEKDGDIAYISSHPQNYLESDSSKQVFSVARLLKDPDSRKPLGIIMTDADNIVFDNMIEDIEFNVSTIVAVLDENMKPLFSNQVLDEHMVEQLVEGHERVIGNHDSYRVVIETMQESGWSIAVLFSDKEVQSQLSWFYRIGAIFAAGGILLTLLLNVSLTHWIVNPFREMVQVMKKVQRGDLNQRLEIKGQDEIAQLGFTLNTMIGRLKELIDREYRAVLGKRDAEYRALQSQIQPHFLYNTLNGFVGLNRSGQHRLLEKAILSLSNMLRYTLEHREKSTLKEEMSFVMQYCELQKLRFQGRLEFKLECDSGLEQIQLPKLLLQPLVENAIIHGIEPLVRQGELLIKAKMDKESEGKLDPFLHILIQDNGAGFEKSTTADAGVGMTNVRERLALFYENARLDLQSVKGEGTLVEIWIPMKDVIMG